MPNTKLNGKFEKYLIVEAMHSACFRPLRSASNSIQELTFRKVFLLVLLKHNQIKELLLSGIVYSRYSLSIKS